MEYFKTTNGFSALWVQNEHCAWVVSIHPAIGCSAIKCECGTGAQTWGHKTIGTDIVPCAEAEFTEIYNRAIEHQRNYRKEVTV